MRKFTGWWNSHLLWPFISSTGDYDLVLTAVAQGLLKEALKVALESIIWQTSGFPFLTRLLEQNQGQQCLKTSRKESITCKITLCASWIFQHGSWAGRGTDSEIFFSQFKRTVKHFIQIIPHQPLLQKLKELACCSKELPDETDLMHLLWLTAQADIFKDKAFGELKTIQLLPSIFSFTFLPW